MASTDTTSSTSAISATTCDEHKRTVDEAFLAKMKSLVERLRLENATLKKSLDLERSGVRAMKAQHESAVRNLKTEHRKKEESLEKQLRITKPEKPCDDATGNVAHAELKRLTVEVQSLKATNKGLQEKLKVAQAAESARAAELRAQAARHDALELAARRDARAQCHKLLEEIKSKERSIIQLQRELAKAAGNDFDQTQRMECKANEQSRKLRVDQVKERGREDVKSNIIQHRKETSYREAPPSDVDSAVSMSSAPPSLSPQPNNDMWPCTQCRAAEERAAASTKECARLTDALRDARDQLELMEFRLLELEDANPDKGTRENLTDSDSGCVSPGSRIKDSASPELKRMDSGYKSPHTPSSPCNSRRNLRVPSHEEFKEDFVKAQVLADIMDSEVFFQPNPVKEHLEHMILNASSNEDRSCLEQVLMMLYNYQALSSSVSEEEFQIKPKRTCDVKPTKLETDIPSNRTHKAIATVSPYSQSKGFKCDSLESLCVEERKPNNVLQESGIFEEVETESTGTQTDVNETFENSELNTEIQRLNSIREKLERQGRNRSLNVKDDGDGLECRCVKLGKKHKQYYERRLKFLEGKVSIYEAAQDVKKAKLAERLQTEFILENRVQELESQLSELQDKYERLEEDCCELEEIENDTRLHWQQLEVDYELCTAQLRDMAEERELSRAQAERLINEFQRKEEIMKRKEANVSRRLADLEKAVPALIAWNMAKVMGGSMTSKNERALTNRMGPMSLNPEIKSVIAKIKQEREACECLPESEFDDVVVTPGAAQQLENRIFELMTEKKQMEVQMTRAKKELTDNIERQQLEIDSLKRQLAVLENQCNCKERDLTQQIETLEVKLRREMEIGNTPADRLQETRLIELQAIQQQLKARVTELEKREGAYLEMLTQADDMWAEMESGYKSKIQDAQVREGKLKEQVCQVSNKCEKMRKKLEAIESESKMAAEKLRQSVEKAQQESNAAKSALELAEKRNKETQSRLKELEESGSATLAALEKARKAAEASKAALERAEKESRESRRKIKELEDSESVTRIALEKAERDSAILRQENEKLSTIITNVSDESKKSTKELKHLNEKFKSEMDRLRKINLYTKDDLEKTKQAAKEMETTYAGDLDTIRKELSRTYKENQELDTTVAELKEEVESLEKQLALTQKALAQCKRKCDDKIKTLSHELSIKTEELEEMRSEAMRSLHQSRIELKPDRTEYIDEGYTICTAVPKKIDYGRMHHSMGYISTDTRCSCPSMRSHLVGQLIEDLFDRIHNTVDDDLTRLCKEIVQAKGQPEVTSDTKAKIVNYLLMAISKELVRSIGDADAKTDTEDWQRTISSMTYTVPNFTSPHDACGDFASLRLEGNAGVLNGASRLASVSCACAAARLCAAVPEIADCVKTCQEEVLDHSDVKVMEEQLANAIESIVNCPSCALGTNAIVWSTDV